MKYKILNDVGEVENTIVADEEFVEAHHPGRWRAVEEVVVDAEPVIEPVAPTKEELLAQLQAIQAQIQTLT